MTTPRRRKRQSHRWYLSCICAVTAKSKEGLIHPPKAVELFMNFGMLDERLFDEEHLRFLCSIEPEENKRPLPSSHHDGVA